MMDDIAQTSDGLTDENTSRFVQAGQVRVHYNEAGDGVPVIFIHGGGPGASGWNNWFPNIGPISKHFRAILIDKPGWGQSDSVVIEEQRFQFNARVLRDMMDELGIEKAHLVGNSMGGGSAAKFAVDYPDRIGKLVLMGSAGGGHSLFFPGPPEGIRAIWAVWAIPTVENFKKMVDVFCYDSSFATPELLQRRVDGILNKPKHLEARKKTNPLYLRPNDLTAELGKIAAETLVIWGRDDRFEALDTALKFIKYIPNADLIVYTKCGHWAQYEQATKFNRDLLAFLQA
jgi:2-hydroxy-6-oxonona-2,4-dienedioate hydrolase